MSVRRSSRLGMIGYAILLSTAPFYPGPLLVSSASAQNTEGQSDFDAGWVSVGADSIFYEEKGIGPAVVLIHDGLVHREIWDQQMPVLSEHFRVIRFDRRGYGASSGPTESFSNVDDLGSLLAHLNVDRASLVAMSSGGRMAIDFTIENQSRVRSLVLVGAVVGGFSYTQHFFSRGGHLPPDLPAGERRLYYAASDPYELYSENVAARRRVVDLVARVPARDHGSFANTRPSPPALKRLGEIEIPTLILVGEFDIPDVHAHAGAINAGINGSERRIVSNAGHLVPIERPEQFNELVLEFLNRTRMP